jgi:hypothetical protein
MAGLERSGSVPHVTTAASIGAAKGGGYARYLESKTLEDQPCLTLPLRLRLQSGGLDSLHRLSSTLSQSKITSSCMEAEHSIARR